MPGTPITSTDPSAESQSGARTLRARTTAVTGESNSLRRFGSFVGARPAFASVACLVLLTVVTFHRQLFDQWTFPWDFLAEFSAAPAFVAATFGHAHPLTWTPFVASGSPVAINPQAEAYFPIWWLFGALRIPLTLNVVTDIQVAHVLFGAFGMLALARARQLRWPWALIAAVAYLFFGGFYGESEHSDILRGFAYLPWLLWSLTPPIGTGARWTRLAAIPLVIWLIVSGAYPAELVSFGIVGTLYLVTSARRPGTVDWARYRLPLLLSVASAAAICVAVLLPYLLASHAGQLYRQNPPTASTRAFWSITPDDLFGLYLNPFAWRPDGSITAWSVGTPILIGLFVLRRESLARHVPLASIGILGLALAMSPKIGPIGRLMAGPLAALFPSRFPAMEYKDTVAIAIIILSAEAWSAVAATPVKRAWTAAAGGCLLILGAALAPSGYASPTRAFGLLAVVVMCCVTLALKRPKGRVFVCVLVALVAVDGWRDAFDNVSRGTTSAWQVAPGDTGIGFRNSYVERLPELLAAAPAARPARTPPAVPIKDAVEGTYPDALGWVADGYRVSDFAGVEEKSLHQAETNPAWNALLSAPWHAYVFPCASVGCTSFAVRLPPAKTWKPASSVRSLAYSAAGITYAVHVTQPMLMVENELSIKGWRANTSRVRLVQTGGPFRAWRLSAGTYRFTATYRQPGAEQQDLAALAAFLLLLGSGVLLWRRRLPDVVTARHPSEASRASSRTWR